MNEENWRDVLLISIAAHVGIGAEHTRAVLVWALHNLPKEVISDYADATFPAMSRALAFAGDERELVDYVLDGTTRKPEGVGHA